MKLKTALFICLKIIALTVILFICWSVAGGVIGAIGQHKPNARTGLHGTYGFADGVLIHIEKGN